MATLSAILLAQLRRRGVTRSATEGIEDTLRALVAAGRAAWPEIEIKASAFVQYLADRLDSKAKRDFGFGLNFEKGEASSRRTKARGTLSKPTAEPVLIGTGASR